MYGLECTTGLCDGAGACGFEAQGQACTDDGNVCTDDQCDGSRGMCEPLTTRHPVTMEMPAPQQIPVQQEPVLGGSAPNCDDGNVCTDDSCNPASGCVNANNIASCDDGDACTTADTCAAVLV